MTISPQDINFYYSGGLNNLDPVNSIGGKASLNLIQGVANNLFQDEAGDQTNSKIEYKCFYIFNTSELYSLYDANIYIVSQSGLYSDVILGVSRSNDVQNLRVQTSGPSNGDFKLKYDELTTDLIVYDNNPLVLANNIQKELNRLGDFSGIVVNSTGTGDDFLISFLGGESNRNHSLLVPVDVNIIPSATITVAKSKEGQPINSEAPQLPTAETLPFGVVFYETTSTNRIAIGDLRPGDGVPIWIKRTVSPTTTNVSESNNFELKLSGSSIQS